MDDHKPIFCSRCFGEITGRNRGSFLGGEEHAHISCMTDEELTENSLCARGCGAHYDEGGEESSRGWLFDVGDSKLLICPRCATAEEIHADASRISDSVSLGKLVSEMDGEEYPPELEERARLYSDAADENLRRSRADESADGT